MTTTVQDGNVIELRNVQKRFGDFVAVHNADISIANGEFFSLLGPSGCGKTTTLRMIAGFELPTSGEIRINGLDVSRTPAHKRNINTVFQHYALFPHLTVAKNIAYGPKSRGVEKSLIATQVKEMLDVVRLSDFANRKPAQLSGGQQQRVALARALVNTPEALLLDEPLGALDLKLRQTMQFELKRIQREVGLAFVYVTHDQEEALTMSDRIAVMNDGNVEQIGSPEEIYNAPTSVFVASFIGQANLWPGSPTDTAGEFNVLGQRISSQSAGPISGDCTVMVRPERIHVSAEPTSDSRTCAPVTITQLTFQGPVVRVDAAGVDGSAVVAHLEAGSGLTDLRPGDTVYCSWPADAARAMQGRSAVVEGDDV